IVFADSGPHGGADFASATPGGCAGCHRAHRGKEDFLVKEATQTQLCYTCHGSTALGADTSVQDGIYLNRDAASESPGEGLADGGLRAGGFDRVVMDPGVTGSPSDMATTSKHQLDAPVTIWGNGSTGSGKTGVTLHCGSCHDPHGNGNYRLLRPIPSGSDAATGVTISDDANKTYTVGYSAKNYRDVSYLDNRNITAWCLQCHTRYSGAPDGTDDPVFHFRHVVAEAGLTCLKCHVVHGTGSTMDSYGKSVEWPDGSGGSGENSRLLSVNNRGVCKQCHPDPISWAE
ncbi:MAG: NapC/NirT family cytochrome c, partial [Chloroflexi bacterium]|nr:NapC/NirT family cytochrome c [Chloroflexota bacterium]